MHPTRRERIHALLGTGTRLCSSRHTGNVLLQLGGAESITPVRCGILAVLNRFVVMLTTDLITPFSGQVETVLRLFLHTAGYIRRDGPDNYDERRPKVVALCLHVIITYHLLSESKCQALRDPQS